MYEEPTRALTSKFQVNQALTSRARRHKWILLFVVLPIMVSVIYYTLIASGQYISESRFVVKSPSQRAPQISTLANLIQTTGLSSGSEQANEVADYLRSRDALNALQKRVGFKQRYSTGSTDWMSRFTGDTFEDLYKYYTKAVTAEMDRETGVVVLKVRAFTPTDARDVNGALLGLSEDMINRLNERSRTKSIAEAEARVVEAEQRIRKARAALGQYRNAQALLDPTKQASGILEVANRLSTQYAALRAQIDQIQRVAPNSPALPSLRAGAASIERQIALQSGRAVGTTGGIASKLGQYESLAAEQEFAQAMLTSANASLAQARAESQRQQFYLERVVEPNTPDDALLPRRFRQILTVAVASICLYLIGWMLVVGVLEHSSDD